MAAVYRTATAREDLLEIWVFIAQDNPGAADILLRDINGKLEFYAEQPRMGTMRDELAVGLRSFPVGNYIIFYRIASDGIELVRVLHAKRDLKLLLMHEGRIDKPKS